ncbi:sulfurtransferase complex subunit TusB [Marinobacter halodurans]|uniref:Sulfurtransferase complex subunit TusB n=1 Tax=Marinobacter halodurans TaxID=2528979 RepID=A0ABY1ZJ59_9GAMM|nr:sulfurtransferase complex subunit TusB [Marinobacter halodurans]TBW54789.1 sulfurtransferase complex subunit TusB [Marinobacter halodurans]
MTCLHILNKAPNLPRFAACLADLEAGDQLLLTENAVLSILDNGICWPHGVTLCALKPDAEARGVAVENAAIQIDSIDFREFVNLTLNADKVVCW